jgi:5-methylcytosine-specific restriction endonuclease McrA
MRKFKYFKTPKVPKSLKRQIVLKEGYGKNWYSQKKKALARDRFTCQKCGYRGYKKLNGRLTVEVHHQVPIREFADIVSGKIDYENANHLANLITLCVPCHKTADGGHSVKSGFVQLR